MIIEPGLALLVAAVLVVLGTGLFVSSPAIKQSPRRQHAGPSIPGSTAQRPCTLLGNAHCIGLLVPTLVAVLVSGNLTIAIPAVFPGADGAAAAGIVLGLFAGGSAVGGLIFGAARIPGRARFQAIGLATILVVLSSAVGLTGNIVGMTITVVAAGAFFSPVTIVAYFAANDYGVDHRKTESTTWVNTSHNIGAAAGSALAGIVIELVGVNASFLAMGAIAAVLVAAASVLACRPLHEPSRQA